MGTLLLCFVLTVSLFCTVIATATDNKETSNDFYTLSATDINGHEIHFEQYRGRITLVVNVASECGYTDYNYHQLEELQNKYGHQRLTVLGFPCNQFGFQEPGNNPYIETLVRSKYKITFPLFSKVEVTSDPNTNNGEGQSPVYKYLIDTTGKTPSWNFCKYLINSDGKVVKFFSERDSFDDIYKSIDHLLLMSTSGNRQHKEL